MESKRIRISHLPSKKGKEVSIQAWVQTKRELAQVVFLIVRDISGTVQVVVSKDSGDTFDIAKKISLESVVEVKGLVKKQQKSSSSYEVEASDIRIVSEAEPELPIPIEQKGKKKTKLSKRLDYRWLDLRKPEKALIFKVWTAMEHAFRQKCVDKGLIQIHSPKLMSSPSESRSELFQLEYFGRTAYLAQSPQFYKQMGQAAGFEGVFEVGPVFRANPSFTSRHDTEITMYDVEISFVDSHHEVMDFEEELIVAMLKAVHEQYGEQIRSYYGVEVVVPKRPFPRVKMSEMKELLKSTGVVSKAVSDLSPEEERVASEKIKEIYGHEFVFVTDYLAEERPFYHMRYEDQPGVTKSFDLLWKGIEITTGAQREHRLDVLKKQAKEQGLDTKELEHYFEFFKYGCPPHGGFGLGPTRMLTRLFEVPNVREVTYLYRGPKRLTP